MARFIEASRRGESFYLLHFGLGRFFCLRRIFRPEDNPRYGTIVQQLAYGDGDVRVDEERQTVRVDTENRMSLVADYDYSLGLDDAGI